MSPTTQSSGWFKTLKNGQRYMQSWPLEKRLSPVFPENRIITATRFAIRFMPPIAVFTLFWQILLGGQWGPVITTALFACSLPVQGLFWLGLRSAKALPDSLQTWFNQIRQKLLEAQCTLTEQKTPPTYQDLATLLTLAFKQLDAQFINEL